MYMKKKIVVLGGGTGMSFLLRGLKDFPVDITAIITVSDSGRSTGKLREEFKSPAVGDTRKVLSNLSELPPEIKEVMEYRFNTYSDLDGHPLGNLVLTAMLNMTGSLKVSIEHLCKLLDVKHRVLPLSEDYLTLMGKTVDGEIIEGEDNLTKAGKSGKKYKEIFYKEEPHVIPEVFDAIKEADLIILSMGSLYTSLLPHLICKDVSKAIKKAKAKVLYVCNAMTQPGETDNFGVSDHLQVLEKYLGKGVINAVIASNTKVSKKMIEKYKTQEQKDQVFIDADNIKQMGIELIDADLFTTEDGTIKHNSLKLSTLIFSYLIR